MKHFFTIFGFTVVEILLVFACLMLVASAGLVLSRQLHPQNTNLGKLNDARRLSDINQIRLGLELFQSQAGGYPDTHLWVVGKAVLCGSVQASLIAPRDPAIDGNQYIYKSDGKQSNSAYCGNVGVWTSYMLQFATDRTSFLGPAGTYCMRPDRISQGKCS